MDHFRRVDAEYLFPLCLVISQSPTPLYSLTLPISFPSLELLESILSLFPELREFSIEITDGLRDFHFHVPESLPTGREDRTSTAVLSMDTRSLDLNDEHAFDEPPADDISDAEEDELNTRVIGDHATGILYWIFEHQLALPPNIEVLRLGVKGWPLLGREEERRAIASLADLHPLLREVSLGSGGWKRIGNVWKWKAEGE
ncbi:hypothetical protein K438DRAFT_1805199 [Mycena galopus ATCC 62051]|nr:hypothetical protein K438DRAFT_1805199 [Mycena galopus ATCC 62051]